MPKPSPMRKIIADAADSLNPKFNHVSAENIQTRVAALTLQAEDFADRGGILAFVSTVRASGYDFIAAIEAEEKRLEEKRKSYVQIEEQIQQQKQAGTGQLTEASRKAAEEARRDHPTLSSAVDSVLLALREPGGLEKYIAAAHGGVVPDAYAELAKVLSAAGEKITAQDLREMEAKDPGAFKTKVESIESRVKADFEAKMKFDLTPEARKELADDTSKKLVMCKMLLDPSLGYKTVLKAVDDEVNKMISICVANRTHALASSIVYRASKATTPEEAFAKSMAELTAAREDAVRFLSDCVRSLRMGTSDADSTLHSWLERGLAVCAKREGEIKARTLGITIDRSMDLEGSMPRDAVSELPKVPPVGGRR